MPQTIISMANAMYSNQHQPQHESADRLDAARALLGVSPNSVADTNGPLSRFGGRASTTNESKDSEPTLTLEDSSAANVVQERKAPKFGRHRSDSAGLEALAFLATKEQAFMQTVARTWEESSSRVIEEKPLVASAVSSSSSSDDDSMPPPPPRQRSTRRRSVSNPEGMEKWVPSDPSRLRFVLPASILEEELAEASAMMKAKQDLEDDSDDEQELSQIQEEEEEEILDPDELLRRARSRLLEDLSEVNLNGEKGIMMLPHSLDKYKEVYNKNGRIGIYTPSERSAIISRYQGKRTRRVWNKKIRYNCRKSLADRRMRVKGRFVKRSTEEQAKLSQMNKASAVPSTIQQDSNFVTPEASADEGGKDAEMPDVSDPDAGFCPTDDLPFRRVRRHTIT